MKTQPRNSRIIILCLFLTAGTSTAELTGSSGTIQKMVDSVSAENLLTYVRTLESSGGYHSRVDYTPGYDSAAAYLLRTFTSFRFLTSVKYDTFYVPAALSPFNTRPLVNVVATLAGKKDPSKIILIGAHLDACANKMPGWQQDWGTISAPGADDDASGVAALVELARVMSDSSFLFSNDYTIQFVAFGAEESIPVYPSWTYGSLHFAQHAKAEGKNILGTICLDMIGYNSSYMYLAVVADSQSSWLGEHCRAMNDKYKIGLIMNTPPFPTHSYSDHASLWASGYPAILLIENYLPTVDGPYYQKNDLYHSSGDTSGTLNFQLIKKSTQLTLAAVAELSSSSSTDVHAVHAKEPASFSLSQNYPNPFNPSTIISYHLSARVPDGQAGQAGLPVNSHITLMVFDILGREVATLMDREMEAGTYLVEWNARDFPGGIYFCRLTHAGLMQVRKMQILK
jgi:hypothetical protein